MTSLYKNTIILLTILATSTFSLHAMKLAPFKKLKCFNQKKSNPIQCTSFSTDNAPDVVPKNLYKTIFKTHYASQGYYDPELEITPFNRSFPKILEGITNANFCVKTIEKNIDAHRSDYSACSSAFFSFALYAAFAHQKRGDARVDQKYAALIKKFLLYYPSSYKDPLWNHNGMWFRKRVSNLPLHEAVNKNALKIVKILSDQGSKWSLEMQDASEKIPLHYAQTREAVDIIMKHYDDDRNYSPTRKTTMITMGDRSGNTPAHTCPTTILPLLLKHGADSTIKNKDDITMLFLVSNSDKKTWKFPPKEYLKERALLNNDSKNIVYTSRDEEQSSNGLCLGYKRTEEWKYNGITPVMESIFKKDVERFKTFLDHDRIQQIQKQHTTLRTIISYTNKHEEPSPEYQAMDAHLEQYEKQHGWL